MKYFTLLISIILAINLSSTTYHIKQDGTGDYTEIQAAIDASTNDDTVLVHPGRYFENLQFNGKNITLASLYLNIAEESYIDNTIIDGSNEQESCIRLLGENVTINGFTISNGFGSFDYRWGGGGGISIVDESYAFIKYCKITENYAYEGGGLLIDESTVSLSGVSIYKNYAAESGGIAISDDNSITFDSENKCNIYNNFGGIINDVSIDSEAACDIILDTFTVLEPDEYYFDYTGVWRNITFSADHGWLETINHNLYVATDGDDNNSGLTPDDPLQTISVAMHRIESDSLNPKTIYIAEGTYSKGLNNQIFPVSCKDYVNIVGAGRDVTILDDEQKHNLISLWKTNNANIAGLSLTNSYNMRYRGTITIYFSENIKIENIRIADCLTNTGTGIVAFKLLNFDFNDIIVNDNQGEVCSGFYLLHVNGRIGNCIFDSNRADYEEESIYSGLYAWALDSLTISNCAFTNNYAYRCGPFNVTPSSPPYSDRRAKIKVNNCLFANNRTSNYEIFNIASWEATSEINNCSFINNISEYPTTTLIGYTDVTNCIFDNNSNSDILLPDQSNLDLYSELSISYSDVVDLETSIVNSGGLNTINYGDGLIDADPMIEGGEATDPLSYMLSANSPCIDTGTPDTTGLHLLPWDIIGNPRIYGDRIDMGCYEWNPDYIAEEYKLIPKNESTLYNYPNPFNPVTSIYYHVQESGKVELNIYNIKGQHVRSLVNKAMETGSHSIIWNSRNDNNESLSSGVYFYKLQIENQPPIINKMVLLK